jgi:hypothetical protein
MWLMHHVCVTHSLHAVTMCTAQLLSTVLSKIVEFLKIPTGYFYKLCRKTRISRVHKNTIQLLLFIYNFVFINSKFIIQIWRNQAITIMHDATPFILWQLHLNVFQNMEIFLNSKLQVVTNLNMHYRINRNLTRIEISNIYTSSYFQGRTKRCYRNKKKV